MMMGASLDQAMRQAIRSGFRNGTAWIMSHALCCLTIFILVSLVPGLGWECEGPIVARGWATFLWFPLGWCKAYAGVGHSWPCGPTPGTCSTEERGSQQPTAPSFLTPGCWFPCLPLWLPASSPCSIRRLQAWVVWPRSAPPLWESKQLLLPPLLCPHLWPCSPGLFTVLAWLLPYPVWVTAANSWAICHSTQPFPPLLGLFTFGLHLLGSYHELGAWYTKSAVEVMDRVMNMLPHPMEEAIPEVLLGLKVCHPSWSCI